MGKNIQKKSIWNSYRQRLTFNEKKHLISLKNGARETEVEEPLFGARLIIFEFEVDEVAEPKSLMAGDLRKLVLKYGSPSKAAIEIGTSEGFVRQNTKRP